MQMLSDLQQSESSVPGRKEVDVVAKTFVVPVRAQTMAFVLESAKLT